MLRVVTLEPVEEEPDLEFDPYVPVTVTWPAYHRRLDAPASVMVVGDGGELELKFARDSGELLEAVLVGVRGVVTAPASGNHAAEETLVPRVVADFGAGAATMELPLQVLAREDVLEVRWTAEDVSWRGGGVVRFGVTADDSLAGLVIAWQPEERASFQQ